MKREKMTFNVPPAVRTEIKNYVKLLGFKSESDLCNKAINEYLTKLHYEANSDNINKILVQAVDCTIEHHVDRVSDMLFKLAVTIEKYIRDINTFAEWSNGREITKTLVLEYKSILIKQYAPASVNSVLSSLNGSFNYIKRYDLKVKNLKVQRQIFCQSEKELTKAEYERLLKAAKSKKNERFYLIMQTICATGIRVSELKYVDVNSVMTGQAQVRLKGKIRMIILPRELCQLLKKYIKEKHITSGSVFVTRKGQPVDRHSIWKSMKQLCETAGVSKEKVFPHNLRHLFARTYYSLQKDIVRLADILGHSSVNTTRIYTIENGNTHRRQMQRMGLVRMQN